MSTIQALASVLAGTDFSDVANQAIPHAYAEVDLAVSRISVETLEELDIRPPGP